MTEPDLLIRTAADLDALTERSHREGVLLFKHSTACPISAAAHDEFEAFLEARAGGKPYAALVRVIEERPLSREIEARLAVKHESPQAIWISGGVARGFITHGAITVASLRALTARA